VAYIGRQQDGFGVRSRFIYTATSNQTTFNTDDSGNALSYSDGAYVDVYLNSVLLDPADYTDTSLTSIVLASGATASDILEVIVYDVFSVFSGTFTNGITTSDATVTGDLTVNTDATVTGTILAGADSGDAFNAHSKLRVQKADHAYLQIKSANNKQAGVLLGDTDDDFVGGMIYDNSTNHLQFNSGDAERMRLDSSGNVGIGTSTISGKLTLAGDDAFEAITLRDNTSSANMFSITCAEYTGAGGNPNKLSAANSSAISFETSGSERMRIDSSGNLLVGTTGLPSSTNKGTALRPVSLDRTIIQMSSASVATGVELIQLRNPNGQVGFIGTNASSTTYQTTSDYRLKENVTDITDGIARIKLLNPSRFNFIVDADTTVDGFLAHEAQEVVPEAVSGEKDAVDEDGNPNYQGIDQSKLVPLLTAALQEAVAKIETLEAKVTALENA